MPSDPRQLSFWEQQYQKAIDEFGPLALRILFEGARAGASALPSGVDLLINWEVVNTAALDWLNKYNLRWIAGINDATRRMTVRAIDNWVNSGEPLPNLEARLRPIYGKERANRIAVTEVTRIYAEGNQAAWKASNVVGQKRWMTAADDLVCPICRPLNGKVVRLDYGFSANQGGGFMGPPAHARCRCWLQPIVDLDLVRQQIQRELDYG